MDLADLNILFLGNCADPDTSENDPDVNASKLRYHREIYAILSDLCKSVIGTNDPSCLFSKIGQYDYVFSLFNRMGFRLSEIYPSSVCEYLKVAYLGTGPDIRAIAENKTLFKHIAKSSGICVAKSVSYYSGGKVLKPTELKSPFFVKPESGANSEWIRSSSYCADWDAAELEINFLHSKNCRALLEEYVDGINLTVPVLGGTKPRMLGIVEVPTNEAHNVLTSEEKLQEHGDMSFKVFKEQQIEKVISQHIKNIIKVIEPIDYFRLDYRYDEQKQKLVLLEINVCCDISSFGSFSFAALQCGISQKELVKKILEISLLRQEDVVKNAQRNHI